MNQSRRNVIKNSVAGAAALAISQKVHPKDAATDLDRLDAMVKGSQVIQKARAVGLDLLKPTARELQHGLGLHKESLVFDGYAFAPRASMDNNAMAKLMDEGGSDVELQDLSEDMGMTRAAYDTGERDELQLAFHASGVTCIYQNSGEECQHPLRLMKRLARFTFLTDMLKPILSKACKPAEIEEAKKAGRHCLYFTGNGVPLPQDWNTVEEELRYIRIFFQLGIRMMHVTYQRRNMLGDGCAELANGGLSDFGKLAVAEMNRQGVLVDVAHSGWKTSFDAAKASSKPVVASHTTATKIQNHIRSKPDEVLKALADSGGYAGICCIPQFLGGKADINSFLDHIDYVAKKIGVDHVSIGTDIAYSSRKIKAEVRKLPPRRKSRNRFASLWPRETVTTTEQAMESLAWTNWPLFTVGLVQRGYKDEDIKKIIGGNVMRVAREVFPALPQV